MGSPQRLWRCLLYGSKSTPEPPPDRGSILPKIHPVAPPLPPKQLLGQLAEKAIRSQGIGGAVWHGVKGYRNSPYGERRIGALTAIKARAPVLGGNFGVWGGLFSTFDCAVKGFRKKEDPWNASMCFLPKRKRAGVQCMMDIKLTGVSQSEQDSLRAVH